MKNLIKNKKVDVSVIVPMYNVENLISEAIESIKLNDCKLEVILINDGSSDLTLDRAYEAVGSDSRFLIIDQENQGVSCARNNGLREAHGDFILFIDSDDVLKPRAIDMLLNAANRHNADYVYGGVQAFNKTRTWSIPIHDKLDVFSRGYKEIIKNPELFYSMAPTAKLISRNLIDENTFFPENISCAEDQVFIFNIFVKAKNIYSLGEYIYFYRERDVEVDSLSITQQKDKKAYQYFLDILEVMTEIKKINSESLIADKEQNLANYYERAITFDVWPLFRRILIYHPDKVRDSFSHLQDFFEKLDKKLINKLPALRYFFIRVLSDHVFHIKKYDSFKSYRSFLSYLFDSFDEGVYRYFSKPTNYGKRWDDSYFIAKSSLLKSYAYFIYLRPKKRFFSHFNKNKNTYIKNYLFPIFKCFPKNKNKIIFATNNGKPMGDNFTYIYRELKKQDGFDKFQIYKFLGDTQKTSTLIFRYFHAATAKTIFLENYYNPYYGLSFSKKTKIIQLWHACGAFKQFAHDALGYKESNTLEFEEKAHSFYTDVVTSADNICGNYGSAFNKRIEQIKALGIPRTDVFFDSEKISSVKLAILKKYPSLRNTINVLYSPTFRGSPSERKTFILSIDWNEFKNLPLNYRLIIKLHPVVEIITPKIPDWIKNRVLLLDSEENVNDWMMFCDTLITDYSSLIFEYSLLNKPIIYYPYDIESYFDERGFYYSYDAYVYGDVAYTSKELINAIQSADIKMIDFKDKRIEFKRSFMNRCDGMASQRIVNMFVKNKKK